MRWSPRGLREVVFESVCLLDKEKPDQHLSQPAIRA
jgi:hypothetical protein